MQLAVKTLKGEKFEVTVEESHTIAQVKDIIETSKSELPAASMKLIHSGKVLKDTDTIADCQLKPNAFLVVMVSKAKKKAAAPAPAPAASTATTTEPKTPAPAAAEPKTPAPPKKEETATTADSSSKTTSTAEVAATPANAAPSTATPSAPSAPSSDNDVPPEAIAQLTAMGFPEPEVKACLRAAKGNADVAVEFLMNGIPDYIQNAISSSSNTAATPAAPSSSTTSSNEPLAELRNHPQINQLRQLVQSNPSTLQQVLTQIGQQQPDLLQEINSHQELFLQIMNEPVTESSSSAPAPAPSSSTSAPSSGVGMGAGQLSPEMMDGLGNPAQLAQMIDTMTPEQLSQMSAMMGLTPDQLRMTAQAISNMPPEELQNAMQHAMGMEDGMGGGGGAPGQQVLRLSAEEMAAVDRLASMGFDRAEAAQAYLACDKNEELAANLLMDGGFGFGDADMGGGGNGGGADGDDMYD
ncbi:RAD23 [Chaetoceros tenuissimus]|uniref:RAD23 n=1 Tax=Chaetoceros tenuissimus TaxID=426638 RepID=A0AAD3DBV4_9STRA|nr:RAD23 [Chaetoceros tenuissimus]